MEPIKPKGRGTMGDFVVRPKPSIPKPPSHAPSHVAQPLQPPKATAAPEITPPKKRKKTIWKRFNVWFFEVWRPLTIAIGVGTIVCLLLGFQIGSLTKGVSLAEHEYVASIDSGKELLSHPSFLIHKLPTYVLFKLGAERVAYYRLVSAVFAAAAVLTGFFVLRRWYSLRVSILGSWLLLTSAWLLHHARLATPEASFLLLMPLLWSAIWMYTTTYRQYAMTLLFAISALSFYIPGFMWLVLGAVIWQRKTIWDELKQVRLWFKIAAVIGVVIGLSPLVYGVLQNPSELLLVAGLPNYLPKLTDIGQNLLNIPLHLVLRGPDDPLHWLGRMPLLDVFSTTMLGLGIYSLRYFLTLIRARILLCTTLFIAILITLGGPVTTTALIPVVYLLIACGIAFLLQQWFTVFPRNPIARAIATSLVSVLVLLVSYYHVSHYFIAWPQTPATRGIFSRSLLK